MRNETINAEMLTHVPLCTHAQPKDVLVLGRHDFINIEIARHLGLHVRLCENFTCIEEAKDASIDVVIINSDRFCEATNVAQINRVLRKDGLVVVKSDEKLKQNMSLFDNLFGVVMTYTYEGKRAILASKKYHPTADIILQRADLIDGLNYYNAQLHLASFALPTFMKNELLGVQKN
ncbi:MAG: spermidine synthase [Sulfurospirillum sp.]|nr:spermidine synthase [Sulfurospirillum sp.]